MKYIILRFESRGAMWTTENNISVSADSGCPVLCKKFSVLVCGVRERGRGVGKPHKAKKSVANR